jgi:hypothetical protein
MKKSEIAAPINPETEVTREDIAKMAGCSLCKVGFVTIRKKWGFPEPVRKGPKGILLYCRSAVEVWLETNDLKNMVFVAADRAPLRDHEKTVKGPSSTELATLNVGIKPKRFSGHGNKTTVHVHGHHSYPEPRQHHSRYSNSSADHQLLVSF